MAMFQKLHLAVVFFFLFGTVLWPQVPTRNSGSFVFAPEDSGFAVTFPTTSTVTGWSAELNTPEFTMQASYGVFHGVQLDDASLKAREIEINRNLGIGNAAVAVRHSPGIGIEVETKGYYLGSAVESHCYIDPDTGESILLYGAVSKDTVKTKDAIQKFFSSIKRNPKYIYTGYHFAPGNSQFEVTFPKKPVFNNEADDDKITDNGLHRAILVIGTPTNGSKLTAYGDYSATTLQAYKTSTDDELRKVSMRTAERRGLSSVSVSVVRSKFGREITVRGNVTVDDVPMLFEKRTYIGADSMIVLEVGSSTKLFPTPDISSFLSSVRLRN